MATTVMPNYYDQYFCRDCVNAENCANGCVNPASWSDLLFVWMAMAALVGLAGFVFFAASKIL